MPLDETLFSVEVVSTSKGRAHWSKTMSAHGDANNDFLNANIVMIPNKITDGGEFIFPAGAAEFYKEIIRGLDGGNEKVAATPESYREIALHSDVLRWPAIIVTTLFFPTVANVIGTEISKRLEAPSPPKVIEMSITIETSHGKCVSIAYKGPPREFVDTIMKESARCIPDAEDARNDRK